MAAVDVRISKSVEKFYEFISLFEPNTENTWKEDLNRLRKTLPRMKVYSFFYTLEIKEHRKITWWEKARWELDYWIHSPEGGYISEGSEKGISKVY